MTIDAFEQVCAAHAYQRRGMFYGEVFLFLQAVDAHRCNVVVESGVMFGLSTRLLSAAFRGQLISIDRDETVEIEGVSVVHADALHVVPTYVKQHRALGVGVLIDGPKGEDALRLKDACLRLGARVVGVHDQPRGIGETLHSHEERYDAERERLNRFVSAKYLKKYPRGSGLAVWLTTEEGEGR